ncbi:MAG: Hpt domain-containing protein [Treponema sp.]|nr:Hpt domain-containing protein [Treponema sp.]
MTDGVVYIDTADGQKRVMNNVNLYYKLLKKFRTENNLNELAAALNAGDYEKAQAAAHTMKGLAANLSLLELYKQSQEAETRIKSRSLESGIIEALSACFTATLEAIDKVLAQDD